MISIKWMAASGGSGPLPSDRPRMRIGNVTMPQGPRFSEQKPRKSEEPSPPAALHAAMHCMRELLPAEAAPSGYALGQTCMFIMIAHTEDKRHFVEAPPQLLADAPDTAVSPAGLCPPMLRCLFVFAALALASPAMAADGAGASGARLVVFVSILPQKQFVERVGGDMVNVQVMVLPGQSPATYDPTPQQMVAFSHADAYFRVGAPFESTWIPRLLRMHPGVRVFDTRAGIALLPMGRGGEMDPHIWVSPPLVKQQAANIRDALTELRPAERVRFESGYERYAAELDALDDEVRRLLAPKTERSFMVFHPAWGYFARAYGLQQVAVEVEGKEPNTRTLARLIEQARTDRVRVIFVQKQFSRAAAQAVARAIGAEVVELDPLAEDFVANTRATAQALASVLR
jgi:zinc transport system substrate-binding protein